MKYYIIAGEASGDLHGANLIKAIKQIDAEAEFRVWGGDLMEAEKTVTNINHIKERAFMGFVEVLKNIFTIKKFIRFAKQDIVEYKPDRLIFIDYPGFNLRIAAWAHENGFKTHYYISPKVWAWNTKRALKIKRIIDYMYVIFPFEVNFYKNYNYQVHYVGNPLSDAIEQFVPNQTFKSENKLNEKPIIALLPGSRKQEIDNILPVMLQGIESFKTDYQIVLAVAPNFDTRYFEQFEKMKGVRLVIGNTYNLLSVSTAAIVTSGTATLETALLNIPQVVCYKTSALNYSLAKRLIKIPFISLVNLIADKEIVKELIQNEFNQTRIQLELKLILDEPGRSEMLKNYKELRTIVGPAGASKRTAELIINPQNL
jgi:lipid-A-disaccharide synthase